jgi:hypothetical protein
MRTGTGRREDDLKLRPPSKSSAVEWPLSVWRAALPALCGIDAWPPEWMATVEKAILTDTYTLDKRNVREMALGLAKAKTAHGEIDSLLAK